MAYPPRTAASDAIARNLFADLTAVPVARGGTNRCMVSVAVVGNGEVPTRAFVAASGSAGIFGNLRTTINNLRGHGVYLGIDYVLVPYSRNHNLILPAAVFASNLAGAAPVPVPANPYVPFQVATDRPRACAETKVIESAADAGEKITGMSTFWWGNTANPCPDPVVDTTPVGVDWAVPCAYCQTNAPNIMKFAETQRQSVKFGIAPRAQDV